MSRRRRVRRIVVLARNFVLWVEARLGEGCEVHVVYEACGFGYGLYRSLLKLGAHCYVIAPQKLDEHNKRVKTDGRDARLLCLRLDGYLAGNKDSLAVIRYPVKKRSARGTGVASVRSLSIIDRGWRPRAAICLLVMSCQRRHAGGGGRAGIGT